jgi:hypothetical protein
VRSVCGERVKEFVRTFCAQNGFVRLVLEVVLQIKDLFLSLASLRTLTKYGFRLAEPAIF